MDKLIDLLISNSIIEHILELSDKYDEQYFVDQFDFNARVSHIKKTFIGLNFFIFVLYYIVIFNEMYQL